MNRYFKLVITMTVLLCAQVAFAFQHIEVKEDGIIANFYYTEGRQSQRPIIFFGGSDGGNIIGRERILQRKIQSYVDQGYAVLSLSYFNYYLEPTLPKSLTHIPLEYFDTAIEWITKQPGVKSDGVAVYGNSRGGELALLLASRLPEIKLVIAVVPSAYIWGSYDVRITNAQWQAIIDKKPCGDSAWTYRGKEIAGICQSNYLKYSPWYKVIGNTVEVEPYAIKVEQMQADVLLLSAEHDRVWPSKEMSERVMARLKANNYAYVYQHISYDSGHNIILSAWKDALSFVKKHFPVIKEQNDGA